MSVDELDEYFKSIELPKEVKLHKAIKIIDVPLFVKSHIRILRNYGDNRTFSLFHKRLLILKDILAGETT